MSLPGSKPATLRARTGVSPSGVVTHSSASVPVRARVQASRVLVETPEGESAWVDGATAFIDGLPSVAIGDRFDQAGAYKVVGTKTFTDSDLPQYTQVWLQSMVTS